MLSSPPRKILPTVNRAKLAQFRHWKEKEAFKAQFVGGRGNKNPVKDAAIKINDALPKQDRVSERTLKRSLAKAEGKKPTPKPTAPISTVTLKADIKAARDHYAAEFAKLPVREEAEELKRLGAAINRARGGQ